MDVPRGGTVGMDDGARSRVVSGQGCDLSMSGTLQAEGASRPSIAMWQSPEHLWEQRWCCVEDT